MHKLTYSKQFPKALLAAVLAGLAIYFAGATARADDEL